MAKRKKSVKKSNGLIFTLLLFGLVLFITFQITRNGNLKDYFELIRPFRFIPELIAGAMYTSLITSPLSVALLFLIGRYNDPLEVAIVAGIGAMLADLIILIFFRFLIFGKSSPFSGLLLLKQLITALRSSKTFTLLSPIVGAVIIASPLPDEVGLMILGASKMQTIQITLLTYILNALGIYIIALTAHNLT